MRILIWKIVICIQDRTWALIMKRNEIKDRVMHSQKEVSREVA